MCHLGWKHKQAIPVSMQQSGARRAILGKLVRSLLLAAAVVGYVKGRRWLAVDDLVRIYRKVQLKQLDA